MGTGWWEAHQDRVVRIYQERRGALYVSFVGPLGMQRECRLFDWELSFQGWRSLPEGCQWSSADGIYRIVWAEPLVDSHGNQATCTGAWRMAPGWWEVAQENPWEGSVAVHLVDFLDVPGKRYSDFLDYCCIHYPAGFSRLGERVLNPDGWHQWCAHFTCLEPTDPRWEELCWAYRETLFYNGIKPLQEEVPCPHPWPIGIKK